MTQNRKGLEEQLDKERAQTLDLLTAAEEAATEGARVAERLRTAAQRIRLARVDAEIDVQRTRAKPSKESK